MDCTHTFHTGAGTGIQRVVRRFADGLLEVGSASGIEVVPARVERGRMIPLPLANGRVAFPRSETAREAPGAPRGPHAARVDAWRARGGAVNRVLGSRRLQAWLDAGPNEDGLDRLVASREPFTPQPEALELSSRDILLSLDSSWVYDIRTALDAAGRAGATRIALLCDVLPLSHPQWFTDGTRRWFAGWLRALLPRVDGVVTISEATRAELRELVASGRLAVKEMPQSRAVHLGAQIDGGDEVEVRAELRTLLAPGRPPAFLTVGTLEPRKNVDFALDVFDELLDSGIDVQWHVVGSPGWLSDHTAQRIHGHEQYGTRLHWWANLRDSELTWCYTNAAALVATSKAEGFGLPLVEARLQGVPVFASDIAVFREVLGSEGRYLPLSNPRLAAAALEDFLRGVLPVPGRNFPSRVAQTWVQRARELLDQVLRMHQSARDALGPRRSSPPSALVGGGDDT